MDGTLTTARSGSHPAAAGAITLWPGVLLRNMYSGIKACIEWAVAAVLLVAAAPVLASLAVLIRWSSEGPVLYSQVRLGLGGRPFRIYKLRTMTHRCEAGTGPVWAVPFDPRVTRVGRWLRDTHLDELPQLWNVLRGEMSLIGPRPERPELASEIVRSLPEFPGRLCVRPGITGLAQMRLPADADLSTVSAKLAHDLHYVSRIGPRLDAAIALSTFFHFVGWAATAASRRLVAPHAPTVVSIAPAQELAPLTFGRGGARPRASAEGLSRAA
jgi:lipopolysaccharide/colanic/teichoic acid biosynthesis glycosyltransferase